MSAVRRSLAVTLASRYVGLTVQFVNIVILSRLLTPAEIGVFSVAVSISSLLTVLRMFGVPNYVIAEKELTPLKLRACFTVAVGMSFTLAGVLYALRGPASAFYGNDGIGQIISVSVFSFLIEKIREPKTEDG